MSSLFSDDFTGTNGDAWNAAKWADRAVQGSSVIDIQSNAGRQLSTGGTGYTYWARARAIFTATADMEMLVGLTRSAGTVEQYTMAGLRTGTTWVASNFGEPADGYTIQFESTVHRIIRISGSTRSVLATISNTLGTDPYWLRFQVVGTTIRYRIWLQSDAEPGTWTGSTTDATHASGVATLSHVKGNANTARTATWDTITIT